MLITTTGLPEPSEFNRHQKRNGLRFFMDTTDEIHIGKQIRQVLERQGRTITWLAKEIGCSRENLYKVFRRKWIHTDMLQKISLALGYDFFKAYTEWYERKKNK